MGKTSGKLRNKINDLSYYLVRVKFMDIANCLSDYLEDKFNVTNAEFVIEYNYIDDDDTREIVLYFEEDSVQEKFIDEGYEGNFRLLLEEAVAYELNCDAGSISIFPDNDDAEYILIELSARLLILNKIGWLL